MKRLRSAWGWIRKAAKRVVADVGGREILTAAGLALLWRGIGGFSPEAAEALVGFILVYVGLWHHLVVVNAMGAAIGRRK